MGISSRIHCLAGGMLSAIVTLNITYAVAQVNAGSIEFTSRGEGIVMPARDTLHGATGVTVELWAKADQGPMGNIPQTIMAQQDTGLSRRFTDPSSWDVHDASYADRVGEVRGFVGAVFDGRYVYFSPWWKGTTQSGKILRYDTQIAFGKENAWEVFDAEDMDGPGSIRGLEGAVFDGQYVYFCPLHHDGNYFGRVLRYNTHAPFADPASWEIYNAENANGKGDVKGFVGAVFDGRFVYFLPNPFKPHGNVLRYDTRMPFSSDAGWRTFNVENLPAVPSSGGFFGGVFDGRYLYMVPFFSDGNVIRYDTRSEFSQPSSWEVQAIASVPGANSNRNFCGAAFDGRFIYLSPYAGGQVVRYDTHGAFTDPAAWSTFSVVGKDGHTDLMGFVGPLFDGRFVYFPPMVGVNERLGKVLRYDTAGDFSGDASWSVYDASLMDNEFHGFEGGVFDGRYVYFSPMNFDNSHGKILRYDTFGGKPGFRLSRGFSSSSFGSTVGSLTFTVGVPGGVRSATLRAVEDDLAWGWHHLAATYDGRGVSLLVDGVTKASARWLEHRPYEGAGQRLSVGTGTADSTVFVGKADEVRCWSRARLQQEISEDRFRVLSGKEEGLIGYWRFEERIGNHVADASAYGWDGQARLSAKWQPARVGLTHDPEITSLPDTLACEDQPYVSRVVATDVDGDSLMYVMRDGPAWISVDQHTGALSGTPTAGEVGERAMVIQAIDPLGGRVEGRQRVVVSHRNHAPVLIDSAVVAAAEDSLYQNAVRASDPDIGRFYDRLRFRLMSGPAWLSLDSLDGHLQGTPRAADVGEAVFKVRVTDDSGAADIRVYPIRVQHTNHAPRFRITQKGNDQAVEGIRYERQWVGTDEDTHTYGDQLRYALAAHPVWIEIDSVTGVASGVPREGDRDTVYAVTLSDGHLADTITIGVTVTPVNDPPTLAGIPAVTLLQDSTVTISLRNYLSDPDDDVTTLQWVVALEDGSLLAASGEQTPQHGAGKPSVGDSLLVVIHADTSVLTFAARYHFVRDSLPVVVTVRDVGGLSASDTVCVWVLARTAIPRLEPLPAAALREDESLTLAWASWWPALFDPFEHPEWHTWTVAASPHVGVQSVPGGFVLNPRPDWYGSDTLLVTATNRHGLEASAPLVIHVLPVNDPVHWAGELTDTLVYTDVLVQLSPGYRDVDDPDTCITFRCLGASWLSVDSQGRISGRPTVPGIYPVTISATDPAGAGDTIRLTITVKSLDESNDLAGSLPVTYQVKQNYPNPFNPSTTIRFGVPDPSVVSVNVYTVIGEHVATLASRLFAPGYHEILWRPEALASGTYVLVVSGESTSAPGKSFSFVRKMMLLK